MRLEPLYRVRFTTPERWSVELSGPHGTEAQNLLFAHGRCEGQVAGTLRAANFPRRRVDDALLPDFRGVVETDDGATILFEWSGVGTTAEDGVRRLVGSISHVTGDERYRALNDTIGTVAGVVEPRAEGTGFDVVLEIARLVWEPPG
jgi:Protein of unknown function (DUF3237)